MSLVQTDSQMIYEAVRSARESYLKILEIIARPAQEPQALTAVRAAAQDIYPRLTDAESAVMMQMISIAHQQAVPAAVIKALGALAHSYSQLARVQSWQDVARADLARLEDVDRQLRSAKAQAWLRQAAALV